LIKVRQAKKSDKARILSFCSNTFSWGDYIDQVWDNWYSDNNGRLLVAESCGKQIALSHVAICPDKKSIWLEGIRVHPNYRRSKIATKLIEKMMQYGSKNGVRQACAIVAAGNVASQQMMLKNGFEVISRWVYYSTDSIMQKEKSEARLATIEESGSIWQYLKHSEIYHLSAKMYVKSWHWYRLDRKVLQNFIKEGRVIVVGTPVDGVAVFNKRGYWNKTNILQIVYLDSASARSLKHLMSFVANLYMEDRFDRLHVICYDGKTMSYLAEKFMIKEQEQFLLYSKIFTM